jgi:hypothetical protein
MPVQHQVSERPRRGHRASHAGQLDPEGYREVVRASQAACAEAIQRLDRSIAQYLADGLLWAVQLSEVALTGFRWLARRATAAHPES